MDTYRILLKVSKNGETTYTPQRRYMFFFWYDLSCGELWIEKAKGEIVNNFKKGVVRTKIIPYDSASYPATPISPAIGRPIQPFY